MKNSLLIVRSILILIFSYYILVWQFEYAQIVRLIGLIGFGFLAFQDYKKDKTWFFIWLGSAILINSILEIKLGQDILSIMSVVWVVTLITSLFIKRIT